MTNEYNPDGKEIRFIDSHYKDLFHIPDGSCVQIHYPDEMVVKPCTFIDEYHTQIGYNVFHICQFAEIMERNGASYMPEPEIMGDEAAWKVGKDRILAVQTCEDGYDYTLLDENYNEIDGGQVDNPELSMLEVRRDILESFGLERRELRAMFYEDVMEQAFEVGRQAVVVNDPIAELAFKLDRFAENFDPYEYMDQVDDVQAHIQEIKADLAAGNTAPYREFLNTAIEEAREETAVEVAKVLKSQLDKLDSPKRESVMEKLAQAAEKLRLPVPLPNAKSLNDKEDTDMKNEKWDDVHGNTTPDDRMVAFLESPTDSYAILQLREDVDDNIPLMFANYSYLQKKEMEPEIDRYEVVYHGSISMSEDVNRQLEDLYVKFNIDHPDDFRGHSMSVSDIVALKVVGEVSFHYVDSVGFQKLENFMKSENYLKNAEMAMEDDYGMIDGIINNGKASGLEERPSVLEQLKEKPVPDVSHKPPKSHPEREIE